MKIPYSGTTTYKTVDIPYNNYNGALFATGLKRAFDVAVAGLPLTFNVAYDFTSDE